MGGSGKDCVMDSVEGWLAQARSLRGSGLKETYLKKKHYCGIEIESLTKSIPPSSTESVSKD